MKAERVNAIIEKHQGHRGAVISILEDIQATYNYLPREALEMVAARTGSSLVDLYGVATFYSVFSLEPRGEHLISVCMGTACHVRGSPEVLSAFEDTLDVGAGQTTSDRAFTLTTVNCLGACALGPVAVMDGEYFANINKRQVPRLVKSCRDSDMAATMDPDEVFHIHALCPSCNRSLMTPDHKLDDHPMIHVTASFERKHGWLRLSSQWGDPRVFSEHEIPKDTVVNFFCPRCHTELHSTTPCPRCEAPTITLLNKRGGIIILCSRAGCKEHLLDLA